MTVRRRVRIIRPNPKPHRRPGSARRARQERAYIRLLDRKAEPGFTAHLAEYRSLQRALGLSEDERPALQEPLFDDDYVTHPPVPQRPRSGPETFFL